MMDNRYSGELLSEEVYQYLIKEYDKNKVQPGITGLIIMIIFLGSFAAMVATAFNTVFNVNNIEKVARIVYAILILFAVLIIYGTVIAPKLTMKHLKERSFTYHIGKVTDKKAENHNDSTTHYVYIDGKKYSTQLRKEDYGLTKPGDSYIIVYVKNYFEFCTRIQDIGIQNTEASAAKRNDKYSADFLSEEVHQYLVGEYEKNSAKIRKVVTVFGLLIIGLGAPTVILPLVMDIFVFKDKVDMHMLYFLFVFLVIGIIIYLVRRAFTSTAKLMKAKQYMYHIGTVTDKEIIRHKDNDGDVSYEYCVYVDGAKYSNLLHRKEDYDLAEFGDRYIIVYVKGNAAFCTRIQDIYNPESEVDYSWAG